MSNPCGKKSLAVHGVLLLALVVRAWFRFLQGPCPFQPMTCGTQEFFGCGWLGPHSAWLPAQDFP